MRRVALLALAVAALLGAVTGPQAAFGQPTVLARASLPDIEDEVMCPSCGETLALSTSSQAVREIALVRRLIARGDTKAQIEQALVVQFGPEVLALPPRNGFDWVVYTVPVALLAIALVAMTFLVRRWRRRRAAAAATELPASFQLPLSGADLRRLHADLARYDE